MACLCKSIFNIIAFPDSDVDSNLIVSFGHPQVRKSLNYLRTNRNRQCSKGKKIKMSAKRNNWRPTLLMLELAFLAVKNKKMWVTKINIILQTTLRVVHSPVVEKLPVVDKTLPPDHFYLAKVPSSGQFPVVDKKFWDTACKTLKSQHFFENFWTFSCKEQNIL